MNHGPIYIGYALCGHCRKRRWPQRRPLVRIGWLKCRTCTRVWRWKP